MSALFDFASLLVVILLIICTSAYLRAWTLKRGADGELQSWLEAGGKHLGGVRGMAWKAARIGERLSPYVAVSCVVMVRGAGPLSRAHCARGEPPSVFARSPPTPSTRARSLPTPCRRSTSFLFVERAAPLASFRV
jgi:hypothetical protein